MDLFTGLRIGELLGLQWKDIDFENAVLTVRRTLNRLKNYDPDSDKKTVIALGEPKTPKSRRQIPLHDIMIKKLTEFKELQNNEKEDAGFLYENGGFVIANEFGKYIEPRTYQDFFYKLMKKADVRQVNFHSLRHTFATRALEKGLPVKVVSEILGHASISITLDLYSHVLMDLKRESIDKMADMFS